MPPPRGASAPPCSRSGPRIALLAVFVCYCVLLLRNSGTQEVTRLVPASSPEALRARASHALAGMAPHDLARPSALGGVPAASVSTVAGAASVSVSVSAGGQSQSSNGTSVATLGKAHAFCTGPFLANTAQPIKTEDWMLADEPPLAPGDVTSVHVPGLTKVSNRAAAKRAAHGSQSTQRLPSAIT
ncbi:hypothetical protein T492DRAFT_842493 [Pavlovales sp. CCMP2436]|nr:hypothetical protein T492DRAFT_842493 [Pavlovales sp. CCMP2436]